jgi:hypothetical protein
MKAAALAREHLIIEKLLGVILNKVVRGIYYMRTARINEIDLLRFFAALLVVFFRYSFRGFSADGVSNVP